MINENNSVSQTLDQITAVLEEKLEMGKNELLSFLKEIRDHERLSVLKSLSDIELKFLYEKMALPLECYEVCRTAYQILTERGMA